MKKRKIVYLICLMMAEITVNSISVQAGQYMRTNINRYDAINEDEFNQILGTLRQMKDNIPSGDYYFRDTGVSCETWQEAEALMKCFNELFLADNEFILFYNEYGYSNLYVEPYRDSDGTTYYRYDFNGGPVKHIMAVWQPDADANELIRQHDEAQMVVNRIVSEAPEDFYQKVKYYNDTLSNIITYDWEGHNQGKGKHSPYYGLVEGTCVCSGYAEAFFALCYYSGIPSAVSNCSSGLSGEGVSDHKIAMVKDGERWKEVDVTWNDLDPGISYDYFMRDMNDEWQELINEPYIIMIEN